ncbi:FG-GAP repeat domain-containing protein [Dankookia sp. P2]|uniref:FG-GAP repeat domain-containing protein n=1 Tax=Dankookia sp. P2 TaxID=3423955 RepID=UPI003D6729F3
MEDVMAFTIQNRFVGDFANWVAPNVFGSAFVEPLVGNFDRNGTTDLALVNHDAGWNTVPVALSDPNGFTIQNRFVGDFAAWAASYTVEPLTGDFNGNGTTDIALINHGAGWNTVPVAFSDQNGFSVDNRFVGDFAGWAATPGVEALAGDFNGNGTTDIALINHGAGWNTVPVAFSDQNGFSVDNRFVGDFAGWAATPGVEALAGDFDGNGTTDIALVNHGAGWNTVPVAISGQNGFTIDNRFVGDFAAWAATPGVEALAGDFDGDGRTDLALVNHGAGWNTVPVAFSGQNGFTIDNRFVGDFAAWAATPGVETLAGDFDGDGRTDLALVNHGAGWSTVPVALSRPSGFEIHNEFVGDFAAWATTPGVETIVGNLMVGVEQILV